MAAFGQTEFGQYHIWPKLTGRIWPTLFGRIWPIFVDRIWPDRIWPIFFFGGMVGCSLAGGPYGVGGPKGLVARRVGDPKGWEPEGVGARTQKKWGPKGLGTKGWGPKGGGPKGGDQRGGGSKGGGPKFRAFFSLSPTGNFILSSLSGGSSREILVVFEAPGRSNVHVWCSRVVV